MLILTKSKIDISTRRNRHIDNEINWEPAIAGELMRVRDEMRRWKNAIHRSDVGPCRTFNCHGLTFGSRRAWIHDPVDVQRILDDDGYVEMQRHKVMPGDIAIFRNDGTIDHSGIVVEVQEIMGPRILSKWAALHEVIHYPYEGPYADCVVHYYRIQR
jgi:hypothetical protein